MKTSCTHCGALLLSAGACPFCGACNGPCSSSKSLLLGAALVGLAGCVDGAKDSFKAVPAYGIAQTGLEDSDGDGYTVGDDCDDENAAIHPGATETPGDGVDSNCDGEDDT